MERVFLSLPEDQQRLLERVARRIRTFAEAQRAAIGDVTVRVPGGSAGHSVVPVDTAGCYAPGGRVRAGADWGRGWGWELVRLFRVLAWGRGGGWMCGVGCFCGACLEVCACNWCVVQYPLPSSVLMTAVTARVAGVKTVWVASPRPAAATVGAAFVAGADGLLAVGGAQAIAALAYGVGKVPACDVIVGPGNRWVTAAKSIVAGRVGIDMLAGPSECLVLADDSADAATVAADLLAQAEHDTDALPVLVTTSDALVGAVNAQISEQLPRLPSRETAAVAVAKGFSVLCASLDEAIAVSDALAPEHLEIHTRDAAAVAARVKHYGGLFIGSRTAEVFGDYGVGPNHVLPTGGTGRYTGGLSVFTFLRVRTWLRADDTDADAAAAAGAPHEHHSVEDIVADAAALARLEGLWGHERAALRRSAHAARLLAESHAHTA